MKKLFSALKKFFKENFTLTELLAFQKMLRNGQGLNVFTGALDEAIEGKQIAQEPPEFPVYYDSQGREHQEF